MTEQPTPSQAKHTTIITGDTPVVSVQFAAAQPADDGRWFRLFNRLVDSGDWARLSNEAARVLIVLARHASRDGTSLPSDEVLTAQSGCSRTRIFAAKKELSAASLRLIARTPHGAWELFPGWGQFAGRKADPVATPAAPVQWPTGGRMAGARADESRRLDEQSRPRDSESHRRDEQSHGRDLLLRLKSKDVVETEGVDDGESFVAEAVKAGVPRSEASTMLEQHGDRKCRDALANALYLKSTGKLRTSVKAYAWHCLRSNYGLFREIEQERERELQRSAKRLLDERVVALRFERLLGSERFGQLARKYSTPHAINKAALVTTDQAAGLDDADLANLIYDRAFARSSQWIPPATHQPTA